MAEGESANVTEQPAANNNGGATITVPGMPAINPAEADSDVEFIADEYDFPATFATVDGCVSGEKKSKVLLQTEAFCADSKNNRMAAKGLPILSKILA